MLSPKFRKLMARNPQLSARELNALMHNLQALSHSGGIDRIIGPAGIHQRRKLTASVTAGWLGCIHNDGPSSEADYSDARYWVREYEIASGAETDALNLSVKSGGLHLTATNIDELICGSHDLHIDDTFYVLVFAMTDAGGTTRYVFSGPAVVVD